MAAVAEAVRRKELNAEIVLVASDRRTAHALETAEGMGLRTLAFSVKEGPPGAWQGPLIEEMVRAGTDLVVLAGFLRVLGPPFFEQFKGRIVNTHPSLLPRHSGPGMYGLRVHEAVLAAHEPTTGASVHVVTPEVDRGPVLARAELPIEPGETAQQLSDRQKPVEHRILVEVLRRFAKGELPLPYPTG